MVNGGSGNYERGGGGGGGRMAIYHRKEIKDQPFLGKLTAYGGSVGPSGAEAGAAGTIYMHHIDDDQGILMVENNGNKPIDKFMHNIGKRLDFTYSNPPGKATSFGAVGGRSVSSSVAPYNRNYHYNCNSYPIVNNQDYYLLPYLFDQTHGDDNNRIFVADGKYTTITMNLGTSQNINRVRIFPACNFPVHFRVQLVAPTDVTVPQSRYYSSNQGYIEHADECTTGSFADIIVGHIPATAIKIDLVATKTYCNQWLAGLSEVEVYIDGNTVRERFLNRELHGASTWVEILDSTTDHELFETRIRGGASLAFMSHDFNNVSIFFQRGSELKSNSVFCYHCILSLLLF